jgi:hypothetical protein
MNEYGAVEDNYMGKVTYIESHFFYHKSHTDWPVLEPGPPRWKVVTNHCSHATAYSQTFGALRQIVIGVENQSA